MGFGRRHLAEMGVPLRGEVNHHHSLTSQNLDTTQLWTSRQASRPPTRWPVAGDEA